MLGLVLIYWPLRVPKLDNVLFIVGIAGKRIELGLYFAVFNTFAFLIIDLYDAGNLIGVILAMEILGAVNLYAVGLGNVIFGNVVFAPPVEAALVNDCVLASHTVLLSHAAVFLSIIPSLFNTPINVSVSSSLRVPSDILRYETSVVNMSS